MQSDQKHICSSRKRKQRTGMPSQQQQSPQKLKLAQKTQKAFMQKGAKEKSQKKIQLQDKKMLNKAAVETKNNSRSKKQKLRQVPAAK